MLSITIDSGSLPWNAGDLGGIVKKVLPELETIDIGPALAEIESLIKTHPKKKNKGWAVEADWPWRRLVERIFAPLNRRGDDTPVLSELTDPQHRTLLFAMKNELNIMMLRHTGLDFVMPKWDFSKPTWRRYLGIEKPGMLDREIKLKHDGKMKQYSIWKWFRFLAAEEVDAHVIKAALEKNFSAREIQDLARDASFMIWF